MSPLAAVQRLYTRYRAIADDTLYLGDGRPRAIFELHPPNLSLADDDTLEVVAQQLAGVFNSLRFATQLLFRLVAVDLDGHAADAEQAGARRGPELAAAGRDYAALLRHLGRTLVLLEPHIYLVIGLEGAQGSLLRSLLRPITGWFMRRTRRGSRLSVAGQADTDLLDQRGEQVALAFDASGHGRGGWPTSRSPSCCTHAGVPNGQDASRCGSSEGPADAAADDPPSAATGTPLGPRSDRCPVSAAHRARRDRTD